MEFLLNRYRNLTVLLMVIAAQLLLLAYQVKSKQDVPLIRVWAVTAVTPLARVIEVVRRNTIGFVYDYLVLVNVHEQNKKLQEENGRLKLENQRLSTDLQTSDRVKALMAFQAQAPSKTVNARIIAMGTGYNSQAVYIDRGTNDGVQRGMAVVTPDGIVGKILAAYPTASMIMKVTDPLFAAGVISQKSHVRGTVKGQGQPYCEVSYIQNQEPLELGDVFYTSGDDRIFPKGLPVGKVVGVKPGRNMKEIVLEPVGLKFGLEEVLVIVEGVHQAIPDPKTASPVLTMLPPPPETPAEKEKEDKRNEANSTYPTEADRVRDKYRRIGEAESHAYGMNGSNVPNFNVNLDPKKAPATGGSPAAAPATGASTTAPSSTSVATNPKPADKPADKPAAKPADKPSVKSDRPATPSGVTQVTPPRPAQTMPTPAAPVVADNPLSPTSPDAIGGAAMPRPSARKPIRTTQDPGTH